MSAADIFRTAFGLQPAAPAASPSPSQQGGQQQTPPGQQTPQGTTAPGKLPTGDNSALEANPQNPNALPPGSEGFPPGPNLDTFAKLWENPSSAAGPSFPALNADPTKIAEVAKTIDFTKSVNPEIARKALSGDINAFLSILNSVGQHGFAVATQASSSLVDRQTTAVSEHLTKSLPNHVKRLQSSDTFMTDNPQLAHPAVQPLIGAIQTQLAASFPTATSAELAKHARDYLQGVLGALGTPQNQNSADSGLSDNIPGAALQQKLQAAGKFDWLTWADARKTE